MQARARGAVHDAHEVFGVRTPGLPSFGGLSGPNAGTRGVILQRILDRQVKGGVISLWAGVRGASVGSLRLHFTARAGTVCRMYGAMVVGACLLWAAVAKSVDPGTSIRLILASIKYVTSATLRLDLGAAVLLILVLFEVVLGGWLFAGIKSRIAAVVCTAFLIVATAWIAVVAGPIDAKVCGCGLPVFGANALVEAGIRNTLLIGLLVPSLLPNSVLSGGEQARIVGSATKESLS